VPSERLLRILARLSSGGAVDPETARLCEVSAEVTGVTGAGIMLMSGDVPRGSVCATGEVSARIEELQYALGEGPCVDAFREDRPVLEPDLAHPRTPRWPAFTGPALEAGVQAVFGFPLRVGAVRLGALNLVGDRAEPLTDEQHADALVMAGVAARAVLALQAHAPPGRLAVALEEGADFRYGVHQAAGMVAVQLGISVGQALIRLRAYAFGNDRPLTEVAEDVVSRRLRFDPQGREKDHGP
jgi:hypothetical protein